MLYIIKIYLKIRKLVTESLCLLLGNLSCVIAKKEEKQGKFFIFTLHIHIICW